MHFCPRYCTGRALNFNWVSRQVVVANALVFVYLQEHFQYEEHQLSYNADAKRLSGAGCASCWRPEVARETSS